MYMAGNESARATHMRRPNIHERPRQADSETPSVGISGESRQATLAVESTKNEPLRWCLEPVIRVPLDVGIMSGLSRWPKVIGYIWNVLLGCILIQSSSLVSIIFSCPLAAVPQS